MGAFTARQRAELRDAVARSRLEAQQEIAALIEREQNRQTRIRKEFKLPDASVPTPAWEITGAMAELLTRLEDAISDLDDDVLSADVHVIRLRLTKVGDRMGRRHRG